MINFVDFPIKTIMQNPYFNFRVQLAIPLLVLLLGTPVFYFTNLDISISTPWFSDIGDGKWEMQSHPFWSFIYTFGVLAPVLALLWGILALLRSVASGRPIDRLRAFCIILCIVIGPGLLAHGILKQHYPRPRPYDIQQFKGNFEFKKILVMGEEGESFPSGHASAGFSLTIFFYLYYLKNRKKAWGLLVGASVIAALLSIARIVQGGHFASDILWSFGLMQIVNVIVFFKILKIPEKEQQESYWKQKHPLPGLKKRIAVNLGSVGLVLLVTVAFMINQPLSHYQTDRRTLSVAPERLVLKGDMMNEKILLYPSSNNDIAIDYLVLSHGFPYTTFEVKMDIQGDSKTTVLNLKTSKNGVIREYRGRIKIFFPKASKLINKLDLPEEKIIWK